MKRALSFLLACVMVLGIFFGVPYTRLPFAVISYAADNGIVFELDNITQTYYVVGLDDSSITEINIPATYNDVAVTSINASAFDGETQLVSVTIPESITGVGECAFYGCTALQSVSFSSTLADVGAHAFYNCSKLSEVIFAENSVSTIGAYAFYGCSSLTSIVLSEGITDIGAGAFFNCTDLNEVWISSTITTIGKNAFEYCENMQKAHIADIGAWCGVSLGGETSSPVAWAAEVYIDNQLVTDLVIPEDVTEIKPYVFCYFNNLTGVTIPASVTDIGDYAFKYCQNLESLVLNDGLQTIGRDAFRECRAITGINLPTTLQSVGEDAFAYCSSLEYVNVQSLEDWCNIVFENESSNPAYYGELCVDGKELTEVAIPDGVTHINDFAFYGFTKITAVSIPNTVEYIGKKAFYNCIKLTELTIPQGVKNVGENAFYNCKEVSCVTINTSCATIVENAFEKCEKLVSINVPSLDVWCGLTFETAKANPLSLGLKLCVDGVEQTELVIPERVTTIKQYTFAGYEALASVSLPATVTKVEQGAFINCPNLAILTVSEDNESYTAVDNVLYTKDMSALVFYPVTSTAEKYFVDEATASIEPYAFYKCTNLKELVLPAGIRNIGSYATTYCSNLKYTYFLGTADEWSHVSIGISNSALSAYLHFEASDHVESDNWEYATDFSCTNGKYNYINKVCVYCDYAFDSEVVPPGHAYVENTCKYCGAQEYEYTVSSKGEISITKYKGNEYYIRIPERINGKFVTEISNSAFANNTRLMSVYIPRYVEYIGASAFYKCTNLIEITGAQNVITISTQAFEYCSSLESVSFGDSLLYIGKQAFRYCDSLENVEVGSNLATIGEYCFYRCKKLQSVELPDSVTTIGKEAFGYCDSLQEFTIPRGVQGLGTEIFCGCRLKNLYIQSELTKIDGSVAMASSIENLHIENLTAWLNVSVEKDANPLSLAENLYINGECVTTLVIPGDVAEIPAYAFYKCTAIDNVIIPGNVKTVGIHSFDKCYKIKSVKALDGVTKIGDYAFLDCTGLESVQLLTDTTRLSLGTGAFMNCTSIESISLPLSVSSLPSYLFCGCSSLKSFIIPSSVTNIASAVFKDCTSLERVEFSGTKISLGSQAFYGCEKLTDILLSGVSSISAQCFENCTGLQVVRFEETIKVINADAFKNCTSLEYVFYEKSYSDWTNVKRTDETIRTKSVHYNMLDHTSSETWEYDESFDCESTETFYKYKRCISCSYVFETAVAEPGHQMENNVCTFCGYSTFTYTIDNGSAIITGSTTSAEKLVIPSSIAGYPVTAIGASAFENRGEIVSVELNENIVSVGDSAFAGCTGLSEISVANENAEIYSSAFSDTAYYNNEANWENDALYLGPHLLKLRETAEGEFIIKDGTVSLAIGAFDGCTSVSSITACSSVVNHGTYPFQTCTLLKTLIIGEGIKDVAGFVGTSKTLENLVVGDGVTSLTTTAFTSCTGLKTVTLGKGITEIPNQLFKNLKNLTSVYFEGDIKTMGNNVFYGCSSLKEIVLPESLETIGTHTFYNCTSLESVELPSLITTIPTYTFYNCYSLSSVDLPEKVESLGSYSFYKCTALKEIGIPEGVIGIGAYAFSGCSALESVSLPQSVTTIGRNAFYNCTKLTDVVIPEGVTAINAAVFQGCSNLVSVGIPAGVESLGDSAFRNCTSLTEITIPESVTTLAGSVFRGCTALTTLVIPDTVTSIGTYLITGCTGLKKVVIGDGVTSVGTIFKSNTSIENVVIGSGVTTYSASAFSGCTSLKYLSLGKNTTALSGYMLNGCTSLKYVYVPESVTSIATTSFTSFAGTVICEENSTIHTYAEENDIPYILTSITATDERTSVEKEQDCVFTDITLEKDCEAIVSTKSPMSFSVTPTEACAVSGAIGTGAVITHKVEECIIGEYTVIVTGDLNGDSVCDVLDTSLAANYSAQLKDATFLEIYAANGHVADEIDVNDYQSIVNMAIA